jgi:hypothetical protein
MTDSRDQGGQVKTRSLGLILAIILLGAAGAFSQSRETGAIVGAVFDQQGMPLPGVNVMLSSPSLMGTRTFVTEQNGSYRFPALPPGNYSVQAELQGFKTVVRENIRLTTTVRLTVDFTLEQSTVAEEVTVIGRAPTIDIKSTETASVTLSDEILRNIPYSQFTADIVNLAPGVNREVAFGAQADTGIAYTMDGVNVADPEAGSAWVFLDHNIIEEAKIMGAGLPAEYGNFTGVIFNVITKSGGNEVSGHFEFNYQGTKEESSFWQADNNQDYIEDFPNLNSPMSKLFDLNAHLGGPIKKDRVWFYLGLQYYRSQDFPPGFVSQDEFEPVPQSIDYKQPRGFFKLTSQISPDTNLNLSLEVDSYNGTNREGSATVSSEATLDQKSPEMVANFSLTHIIDTRSFFDLKGAYFWGYYNLDPKAGDVSAHFDEGYSMRFDSAGTFSYNDRSRFQVNASYTHYTEDFIAGSHDFKFGVEVERSYVRNRFGYTGPNQTYYVDFLGEPFLAYQYEGYDLNTYYTRLEGFLQDSWQISPRLNINAGVRLSQNWGTVKDVEGTVYSTFRLAPRVGFTFDLLGDRTTVFKAHYGQYTEAMLSSYHDRLNPSSAFSDYVGYFWNGTDYVEFLRIVPEDRYKMAEDIKHPYMDQYVVGIERELFRDASLSLNFIYRKWNNIIGLYDLKAEYEPYSVTVPDLNKTVEIYERTIDTVDTSEYILANIKKGDPWIPLDPYRKYWGLEFVFNKRFSNRWQLLMSYIYSKASGTIDNRMADDIGYNDRDELTTADPNYWINAEGNSTYNPTHQLKVQGTFILPLDISFNAYYRAITGDAWTTRCRTELLNQGRVTFFAEPRGSYHYPIQNILDLRLEKVFTLAGKYRLGLMFDVFNVLNAGTIEDWGTRIGYDWIPGSYPSTEGHELYGIVAPRRARIGIRLIF